jgi:hypothetical protein
MPKGRKHTVILEVICKIIFFLSICYSYEANCQVQDFGAWIGVNGEKKITQKLAVSLSQEIRLNENASEVETFFTDCGLGYKIKAFKFSANYRFINKREINNFYSNRHRTYLDITYKQKIKKFQFSFRERLQVQFTDYLYSETGKIPRYLARHRLLVKYLPDKRIKPYIGTEMHIAILKMNENYINEIRGIAGITYELNKSNELELFFIHKREVNVRDPWWEYIIGFSYNITF